MAATTPEKDVAPRKAHLPLNRDRTHTVPLLDAKAHELRIAHARVRNDGARAMRQARRARRPARREELLLKSVGAWRWGEYLRLLALALDALDSPETATVRDLEVLGMKQVIEDAWERSGRTAHRIAYGHLPNDLGG